MNNRNSVSIFKNFLSVALFCFVFFSGTVYSSEAFNIGWEIDSLKVSQSVSSSEINYLEIDATIIKRFIQVNGLAGYTNGGIQLINGTGFDMGNGLLIQATIGLDLLQISLNYDGNGLIEYYTVNNENELVLVDSAALTLAGYK